MALIELFGIIVVSNALVTLNFLPSTLEYNCDGGLTKTIDVNGCTVAENPCGDTDDFNPTAVVYEGVEFKVIQKTRSFLDQPECVDDISVHFKYGLANNRLFVANVSKFVQFDSKDKVETYNDISPCYYLDDSPYTDRPYTWTFNVDGEYLTCQDVNFEYTTSYYIQTATEREMAA
mmetsp:Transcript_35022/g.98769  ORF Transcript_35022/g.98769 Transcript_35022/m.98769 type:complete len:176 (+) Transcript_35022:65-592(+)|eukprot:CAMPEP_0119133478 /NCGR_PEP_ID=MMETSP1310-20130426/13396_1 /TAXON_ID=464262 /ORGANISM="Genus nov. species nov., Strain RCC2339" /LENGTH=175 /DNA_ID=CAMNT_0007124171 /DNA_START=74 /DNA_END=601 /DNA_ORIENTATION=-